MKYIKLFEKFTKEYQTKIDVKDFKKIKKGSKILYMGGQVEVLDNNGYVLKLKGEDGRIFTINKSQFDHGGMIKEVDDGKKKKKKKPFHPDMMYEAKGKKVINDLYKMDGQIDYLSDADDDTKKIWKKAGVNPEDDNMIILYSYVNSWPETKKLLDKSRIKYKELEDPNSAGESFIVFDVNESVINEFGPMAGSGNRNYSTNDLIDRIGDLDDILTSDRKAYYEWEEMSQNYLDGQRGSEYWGDLGDQELEDAIDDAEYLMKKYRIKESVINELRSSPVSGTKAGFTQSLEDRKYELKKDAKGATIGNFSNVTLPKGTIIYNLPGGVFADHFSLKNKYASRSSQGPQYFDKPTFKGIMIKQTPALLSYIEKNSKVLESVSLDEAAKPYKKGQRVDYQLDHKGGVGKFADAMSKSKNIESGVIKKRTKGFAGTFKYELTNGLELYGSEIIGLTEETYNSRVNELSSAQDGTKDSDGKHRHEHHLEEDIEAMWKKAYGENFSSQYPAVAKVIKQRKIKDKREIARIWQDTYGEDFEKEYPALYQKLS